MAGDDDQQAFETVWSGSLEKAGLARGLSAFPEPGPLVPEHGGYGFPGRPRGRPRAADDDQVKGSIHLVRED